MKTSTSFMIHNHFTAFSSSPSSHRLPSSCPTLHADELLILHTQLTIDSSHIAEPAYGRINVCLGPAPLINETSEPIRLSEHG